MVSGMPCLIPFLRLSKLHVGAYELNFFIWSTVLLEYISTFIVETRRERERERVLLHNCQFERLISQASLSTCKVSTLFSLSVSESMHIYEGA